MLCSMECVPCCDQRCGRCTTTAAGRIACDALRNANSSHARSAPIWPGSAPRAAGTPCESGLEAAITRSAGAFRRCRQRRPEGSCAAAYPGIDATWAAMGRDRPLHCRGRGRVGWPAEGAGGSWSYCCKMYFSMRVPRWQPRSGLTCTRVAERGPSRQLLHRGGGCGASSARSAYQDAIGRLAELNCSPPRPVSRDGGNGLKGLIPAC